MYGIFFELPASGVEGEMEYFPELSGEAFNVISTDNSPDNIEAVPEETPITGDVSVDTGTVTAVGLDIIHHDLILLTLLLLFFYCSGLIRIGFRSMRKIGRKDS